jgi:hypothetical protein
MFRAARMIRRDPWLRPMMVHVAELMNDPTKRHDHLVAEFLQTTATSSQRASISLALTQELLAVGQASDRIVACRAWIERLASEYCSLRAMFLNRDETLKENAGPLYHPSVSGLAEHLDAIIGREFYEEYRRAGTLEEARDQLRARNLRLNFDLNVANIGRCLLGDYDSDRPDWFRPFVNATTAFWEDHYRRGLGLPPIGDSVAIMTEHMTLKHNLLAGYKFPLDGVWRIPPCANE